MNPTRNLLTIAPLTALAATPAFAALDLKAVYDNLLRGSRNHLRALVREIER
ncbi:MAG: DUF2202 domain-containing protein [Candidatus Contendobacter sp.]|jgi:hypothetical protein|nr:DUF2202 domain-containing protein [Candidatus Contendobacter sp.]